MSALRRRNPRSKALDDSRRWFREARYGMLIHFGLYSTMGRGECAMCFERIPLEEYRRLTRAFNPARFNLNDWVSLAKRNGMRYMCLTARHCDGFALFDTAVSDFNSVRMIGRDFIREYVAACRKAKMGVGIYYNLADYGDPGFRAGPDKDPRGWKRFVGVAHAQIVELMTNYGAIDYLFYDGCPFPATWGARNLNRTIRRLQPGMLINDRCHLDMDVHSAESHPLVRDPGRLWELCMTVNDSWGYDRADRNWKTARQLVTALLSCAHNGGNLLLDVGPNGDGGIQPQVVRRLGEVGVWLQRNAEAVYGAEPHPFNCADQRLSTFRGHTAYVPLIQYHGPDTVVAGIASRVESVRVCATGESVKHRQDGLRLFLTGLPRQSPDPLCAVLAVELDGEPRGGPHPLLNNPKATC